MEKMFQQNGRNLVISTDVINTINALPVEERLAITSALAGELILGIDPTNDLSPVQAMIYAMIKGYVKRDTARVENFQQPAATVGRPHYQSA